MKISSADVVVTSPSRNFVTLKVTTDDGVTGLGDATLNGRELAVATYLTEHVVPLLIGKDPHRIEDTWQFLYRSAYWRRGPVTMAAIAAVDMALWDIKGKVANLPVYQLLGGASRNGLLAYGHASGLTIAGVSESVHEHHGAGLPGDSGTERSAWDQRDLRRRGAGPGLRRTVRLRARGQGSVPRRGGLGHPRLSTARADGVRSGTSRVRARAGAAA